MKNKKVLISGAGIAGLTLAYFLNRQGFIPMLIEKHPTLRTGGYKIDIRGVALDVVRKMDLYEAIFEKRTQMKGATFVDPNGDSLTEMNSDLYGLRSEGELEIVRGDLCEILMSKVSDVEILFGDSIRQITQNEMGVYVEFEKAEPRHFDLVVGADGLHSLVRKLVFGDESQFLHELGIYISFFTIPNFLGLDAREIEYQELRKFVNVFSTHGSPHAIAAFAFCSKSLPVCSRSIDEQKQYVENAFAKSGWEVPKLLSAMKDTPDFYFDSVAQVKMSHWSKGRVVLLGDAGYCPSPLSGQGSSLALVGAYILAGELALADGEYREAFSQYEDLMQAFVKKNQKLAIMSAKVMTGTDSSPFVWINHYLRKLIPKRAIHAIQKWSLGRISKAANSIILKDYSSF